MHESNLSGGLIHSTFCFDSHLIRFVIVKRKDVFSNFIFKKKIKIFLQSIWGKNLEWLSCESFQMQKVLFDRTKGIDLPISPNPDFLLPQVFSHLKVQVSRRYQVDFYVRLLTFVSTKYFSSDTSSSPLLSCTSSTTSTSCSPFRPSSKAGRGTHLVRFVGELCLCARAIADCSIQVHRISVQMIDPNWKDYIRNQF